MLDFSTDFNPLGPPETVKKILPQLVPELSRRPQGRNEELLKELARPYPVWEDNVVIDRSFSSLLGLIIAALQPKRTLIFEPCSTEYRRTLNLHNVEVISQPLLESESFQYKLPKVLNAIHGVDMLIIGNPNDPTGTALSKEELSELLEEAKRRNVFVVIDESFGGWKERDSAALAVKDNSYFIVVGSLSNFYSLPGIGIEYGIGARKLIERLRYRQDPAGISRVVEVLNIEALRDRSFQEESQEWFREETAFFYDGLKRIEGIKLYPGEAVFTLVRLKGRLPIPEFLTHFQERSIRVRTTEPYSGLDSYFLRISMRTREDNAVLMAAAGSWLKTKLPELRISLKQEPNIPLGKGKLLNEAEEKAAPAGGAGRI